jgi:PTH1 family peptidyl-tRNA hydrolase
MNRHLIVGLGNPGDEYQQTRHNIGFLIADAICKKLDVTYSVSKHGWLAQGLYKGRTVFILKPSTYMNLSGTAVQYWMQKERIDINHIMVAVDELALPFGTLRMGPKGSDGGHNGLHHIQHCLNTTQYPRLRFGIGAEFTKGKQVDYVLGTWSASESKALESLIEKAAVGILDAIFIGLERAMNSINSKS